MVVVVVVVLTSVVLYVSKLSPCVLDWKRVASSWRGVVVVVLAVSAAPLAKQGRPVGDFVHLAMVKATIRKNCINLFCGCSLGRDPSALQSVRKGCTF